MWCHWAVRGLPLLSKILKRVDRFDVMIRANIAIAVRRLTTAPALCQLHPLKCEDWRRHCWGRRKRLLSNLCSHGDDGTTVGGAPGSGVDIASSVLRRIPLLWGCKGGFAGPGPMDRTDHRHDLRFLSAGSILRAAGTTGLLGLLCASPWANKRHSDAEEAKKQRQLKRED